ncbi:MAG: hypothetical protein VXW22_09255, partial [Pseudomonadota bacterium]|nr:hypothetical protein [Pseudomonadota bacterium]
TGQTVYGVLQKAGVNSDGFLLFTNAGLYDQQAGGIVDAGSYASNLGYVKADALRNGLTAITVGLTNNLVLYDQVVVTAAPHVASDVVAFGNRFFTIDTTTDQIQFSVLGTTDFVSPGSGFFTAEQRTDQNRAIHVHNGNMYIAGVESTEIWVSSPDADLPVAYSGATIPVGCSGPGGIASTGRFMAMVGSGADGYGVYAVSGASVEKISEPWIDRILQHSAGANQAQTILAQCYNIDGHDMLEIYVRQHGGAVVIAGQHQGTQNGHIFTYDWHAQSWSEFRDPSWADQTFPDRRWFFTLKADLGNEILTKAVVRQADASVGIIERDGDLSQYFGNTLEAIISYVEPTDRAVTQRELTLVAQFVDPVVGTNANQDPDGTLVTAVDLAANGGISYYVSDNLGHAYRGPRAITINLPYDRDGHSVKLRNNGQFRQPMRVHQFRLSQPYNWMIGPLMIDNQPLRERRMR